MNTHILTYVHTQIKSQSYKKCYFLGICSTHYRVKILNATENKFSLLRDTCSL
jgi:hypothetical protein